MSIAAGIDIGNSTTEVVIARLASGRVSVLGAAAARTRRTKGSPESLDGAESLVRRLERQHGVTVTLASAAPLRRVETSAVVLP
nr:diol dehydratase reactivase [Nocardioidaceae bacterium]